MMDALVFLLAVAIEIIFFCALPAMLRLMRKKPYSSKAAWRIAIINFAICITVLRVIAIGLLGEKSGLPADLLSGLLTFLNVYILKYDKENPKKIITLLKEDYKTILKYVVIGILIVAVVAAAAYYISKAYVKKVDEIFGENEVSSSNSIGGQIGEGIGLKDITLPEQLNNTITNKDTVIILYTADGCPFCSLAMPVVKEVAIENKMTNMYHFEYTGNLDVGFEIEGFPVMAIYKNGQLTTTKLGYYEKKEVVKLLKENNVLN